MKDIERKGSAGTKEVRNACREYRSDKTSGRQEMIILKFCDSPAVCSAASRRTHVCWGLPGSPREGARRCRAVVPRQIGRTRRNTRQRNNSPFYIWLSLQIDSSTRVQPGLALRSPAFATLRHHSLFGRLPKAAAPWRYLYVFVVLSAANPSFEWWWGRRGST